MGQKDFENIQRSKNIVLSVMVTVLAINIMGPLLFYDQYIKVITTIQKIYMIKYSFFLIMIIIAAYHAFNTLNRVQRGEKLRIREKNVYHAIVIPIYEQGISILRQTIKRLADHQKSKAQYLIFLAMQKDSHNPEERAKDLQRQFSGSFRLFRSTFHQLQPGQGRGKASNENWCCRQMEEAFLQNSINPDDVLFTTIDCDNWAPQAYFEEIQIFLSKHEWKLNNYMFAPNQMFSINSHRVNVFNRCMDYIMGSVLFVWSNNISKVQNAASNYTLSFRSLQQIGYIDPNPDAMCDDFHTSMKFLWKKSQRVEIIPIFVMFNFMSLQTGCGTFQDVRSRFWQAERHMRSVLDVSYNLNMLLQSPFKIRSFWASICFFENHFIQVNLYIASIISLIMKIMLGKEFTQSENNIVLYETIMLSLFSMIYYFVAWRSSKILYKQVGSFPFLRCLESIALNKIITLTYAVAQMISTFRAVLQKPVYIAALKNVSD